MIVMTGKVFREERESGKKRDQQEGTHVVRPVDLGHRVISHNKL